MEIDLKPDENKITVTMTEDAQALDEVVVVANQLLDFRKTEVKGFRLNFWMLKFSIDSSVIRRAPGRKRCGTAISEKRKAGTLLVLSLIHI